MKKPRVVILGTTLAAFGGAEVQIVLLLDFLSKAGERVGFIKMVDVEHERDIADVWNRSLSMNNVFGVVTGLLRFVCLIWTVRPDVLLAFNFPAIVLGRLAKLVYPSVRLISCVQNQKMPGGIRLAWLRMTRSLDFRLIMNADSTRPAVVESGMGLEERIGVILNGVALTDPSSQKYRETADAVRRKWGWGGDDLVWIAVARMEKQKNYPGLLRAFDRVRKESPVRQRLVIVGDGREMATVKCLVSELELSPDVHLAGFVPTPWREVAAADAYVLASDWEGMSNSLQDAMALGLPVVATKVGGVEELFEDGRAGFMAEVGEPDSLVQAMLRMSRLEPRERQAMGRRARDLIVEGFSVPQKMAEWHDLIRQASV